MVLVVQTATKASDFTVSNRFVINQHKNQIILLVIHLSYRPMPQFVMPTSLRNVQLNNFHIYIIAKSHGALSPL